MIDESLIIGCACSHLRHSIRFSYFPAGPHDHGEFEAYVDVLLDYEPTIWGRLKIAWRYLRRKTCGYGDVAECILRQQDLPKIRAWIERAEKDAELRNAAKQWLQNDAAAWEKKK